MNNNTPNNNKPIRPQKHFSDCGLKSKLQKFHSLLNTTSSEELSLAIEVRLKKMVKKIQQL